MNENAIETVYKKFKGNIRQYAMLIALATVILIFQIQTKAILLGAQNINSLVQQFSYILILSIGMLLVILTGNIDLSVGSVVAISGAISGILLVNMKVPVLLTILITLAVGILIGCWNGFWIAYFKIPAFIVTLSSMLVFRGLTMQILQGKTVGPFPDLFKNIASGFIPDYFNNILNLKGLNATAVAVGIVCIILFVFSQFKIRSSKQKHGIETGNFLFFVIKLLLITGVLVFFTNALAKHKGIQSVLILLVVLVAIYTYITSETIYGRQIYAYGGNAKAAQLSGIDTKKVLFSVFVNMSFIAALAGIIFAGRVNAAMTSAGDGFELDAIAACYIGGASNSGGIGTVMGAIIGGLIMAVLNNGMSIVGIGSDRQMTIKGLVLLGAVAFDVYTKTKSSSSK